VQSFTLHCVRMFAHEDKIDEFFKDFIQAPIKWPEPEPPSKEWEEALQRTKPSESFVPPHDSMTLKHWEKAKDTLIRVHMSKIRANKAMCLLCGRLFSKKNVKAHRRRCRRKVFTTTPNETENKKRQLAANENNEVKSKKRLQMEKDNEEQPSMNEPRLGENESLVVDYLQEICWVRTKRKTNTVTHEKKPKPSIEELIDKLWHQRIASVSLQDLYHSGLINCNSPLEFHHPNGTVYRALVTPRGTLWWKGKSFSSVQLWLKDILAESPRDDDDSIDKIELNEVTVTGISMKELRLQCLTQNQNLATDHAYP
jgi:hypothetical protein